MNTEAYYMWNGRQVPETSMQRMRSDFEAEARAHSKQPEKFRAAGYAYVEPYLQAQWSKYVDLSLEHAQPLTDALTAEATLVVTPGKWDHLPAEIASEQAAKKAAAESGKAFVPSELVTTTVVKTPSIAGFTAEQFERTATLRHEEGRAEQYTADTAVSGFFDPTQPQHADNRRTVIQQAVEETKKRREEEAARAQRRAAKFADTETGDIPTDLTRVRKGVDDMLLMELALLQKAAEKYRREQPSLSTTPIDGIMDYSSAGNAIAQAMHHLDEALPTGQRIRGQYAYDLLKIGVDKLGVWMRQKGYDV